MRDEIQQHSELPRIPDSSGDGQVSNISDSLRIRIVEYARELSGVKVQHQGRTLYGVDCIGLVVLTAKKMGFEVEDCTDYSAIPDGVSLVEQLERKLVKIEVSNRLPGDVAVFAMTKKSPQHLGIFTDIGVIHTYSYVGKVVEHAFTKSWADKLVGAYRFKELSWQH